MKVCYDAVCDIGCVRTNNEDMILVDRHFLRDESAAGEVTVNHNSRFCAIVADGMGGCEGGELASDIASQEFDTWVADLPSGLSKAAVPCEAQAFALATHDLINRRGEEIEGYHGMGTTLAGVFFYENKPYWINIGDSRIYIFRDGKGPNGDEPPTNWQCAFGGSAWEWEPRLGKWYLHMHDVSQPDLDWTNPEVRAACAGVVRFWRERGVTGFRFDVINLISKPEAFEDVPGSGGACRALVADGPHVHEYLRELVERAGIDGMVTVGEMASTDLENCIRYTRPDDHELSMSFSFHHLKVDYAGGDKWALAEPDISALRDILRAWQEGMQAGGGWNALFWDNHDQPRAITRFGGRTGVGERGGSWEHVGKMLATLSFLMKGTPYVFEGDELGMTNAGYASIDDFDDVESKNAYRALLERGATPAEALRVVGERSRDNGRTPMQWTAAAGAGFTTGTPWLGIPANHALVNAAAEVGVEGSLFEHYRRLVALRHDSDVVAEGAVRFLDAGAAAPKVVAFERTLGEKRLVVACSFDDAPCELADLGCDGLPVLLGTYDDAPTPALLRPHEAVVWGEA